MDELRQEGKEEQSGFRIEKLRHHPLAKGSRRLDQAGSGKMKVACPFKQSAHTEKEQIGGAGELHDIEGKC